MLYVDKAYVLVFSSALTLLSYNLKPRTTKTTTIKLLTISNKILFFLFSAPWAIFYHKFKKMTNHKFYIFSFIYKYGNISTKVVKISYGLDKHVMLGYITKFLDSCFFL